MILIQKSKRKLLLYLYSKENDTFTCPIGEELKRTSKKVRKDGSYVYSGKKSFCNDDCIKREKCTKDKNNLVKTIRRHQYQDYIDYQERKGEF